MKEESFQDLLTIFERVFVVVDREGGWTPARQTELADRLGKIKLNKGERLALYPKMEEAGLKSDLAQAKALGVNDSTVRRDKGKKSSAKAEPASTKSSAKAEPAWKDDPLAPEVEKGLKLIDETMERAHCTHKCPIHCEGEKK